MENEKINYIFAKLENTSKNPNNINKIMPKINVSSIIIPIKAFIN
jgi:hypothetical protein